MAAQKSKKSAPVKTALPTAPLKDRAVEAALTLSETLGWDMLTLSDIADETGASLAELRGVIEDKTDILVCYGRMLDAKVLAAVGAPDPAANERDRLFEIFMERFDRLNDHRAAILSILGSFKGEPAQAVISLPHLGRSMAWMMEAAAMDIKGIKGGMRLAAVSAAYLYALRVWTKDDTEDLSRTMSAVDKALDRVEKSMGYFKL